MTAPTTGTDARRIRPLRGARTTWRATAERARGHGEPTARAPAVARGRRTTSTRRSTCAASASAGSARRAGPLGAARVRRRALHPGARRGDPGQGDRRAAERASVRDDRLPRSDHPARHHPGLLHRRRADADGRLAGPPARPRAVPPLRRWPTRCGSSAPTPTGPGRPPSSSTAALLDGLDQWGTRRRDHRARSRSTELRNFGVWTPDGLRDVTSAFRQYQADDGEARADGRRRPAALAGRDRPLLPDPARRGRPDPDVADDPADVLRAAARCACAGSGAGFHRLIAESPGPPRIIAATHSGPIRAFATWAHGYDPGEPLQHRGGPGQGARGRPDRARLLPQPGHRGERAAARRVPRRGRPEPDDGAVAAPARPRRRRPAPAEDDAPLRSVSIAVAVLDCFDRRGRARRHPRGRPRSAIAKSTACRMLAALATGGLLERTGSGRYRLGLRLFEYGQLAVDRLMLRDVALPVHGRAARACCARPSSSRVPVGTDVLYVERTEAARMNVRFRSEHRRNPAHSSSTGQRAGRVRPDAGHGDPRARVRPVHAVHGGRPAALPADPRARPASRATRPRARSSSPAGPRSRRRSR